MRLVKDTNIFVAALRGKAGASRRLLRALLERRHTPLMDNKLYYEFLDLLGRKTLWEDCDLSAGERGEMLDALAAVCEPVRVSRLFRPNLHDEGDNFVMELAICGNAAAIVTFNTTDFLGALFAPPGLQVLRPAEFNQRYL